MVVFVELRFQLPTDGIEVAEVKNAFFLGLDE